MRLRLIFWIAAVGLSASLVGCDPDGDQTGPGGKSYANACPDAAEVARRGVANRGQARGDVDGDRRVDQVSILVDARARPSCRHYVIVRSTRVYGAPVVVSRGEEAWGAPRLSALVDIGPGRAAEIAVLVGRAAAADRFVLFQANGERVTEVKGPKPPSTTLTVSTSASGIAVVDCVPRGSGKIVATTALREDGAFMIERRFYLLHGERLLFVRRQQIRSKKLRMPELKTRSFDDLLFRSCTVARARPH
jgi:hypothetical protein